jgi:hypothetical protein
LVLSLATACAAESGYETQAQEIWSVELDAEQATLRYALHACYTGVGEPSVELELSPWIDFGEATVEAVFEADLDDIYLLSDKRPPVAPLVAELDATTACETGVVVRFTLAKPSAGKIATLAWVVDGRAFGDDPDVGDGELVLTAELL